MAKNIITIDEDLCIGCGICAQTCKQSAIEIVDGKAKVTSADFCDGIGNCLPVCPVNAISFKDNTVPKNSVTPPQGGCPGRNVTELNPIDTDMQITGINTPSALRQWPVQIKLVPHNAPYFNASDLLIAADCTAYAYANFHAEFMKGKITLIGCPKLDDGDYTEKLTAILTDNNINSLTVIRMEVPCCSGIENAAAAALKASGKTIPFNVVTISTDGKILNS